MALLVQVSAEGIVQRLAIERLPVTIGRHAECELVVNEKSISRQHARIEKQGEAMSLTDLESTHRTFVNTREVKGTVPLVHADRIMLAKKSDVIFLEREDPDAIQTYIVDIQRREGKLPPDPTAAALGKNLNTILDNMKGSAQDPDLIRQVNEEVQRSVFELKCLYEIGNAINSELDLAKVLELILSSVLRSTKAERGFILLCDSADRKTLIPATAMNADGHLDPEERNKFSTSLASEALERRECIVSADADLDPEKMTQSVVSLGIRWSICAPLHAKSRDIGVLYVDALENRRKFGDKDIAFFTALANQSAIAIENAQLYTELTASIEKLDRKVIELTTLYSISKSLMNNSDSDSILATILDKSIETIGAERGSIMMRATDEDALEVKVIRGESGDPAAREQGRIRLDAGIAGAVMETGQGIIENDGPGSTRVRPLPMHEKDLRQVLCVPFKSSKDTLGVITLVNKTGPRVFTQDDLDLLTSITSQAAVTLENTRLYDLAVYDGLTRVYIRRYFDAWLIKEFERSKRYGSVMSIILVDIDHFKRINDTYGHQTGDAVLVDLAKTFKDSVRSSDVVARYGGEEFIIGLPDTSLDGAVLFADRLRNKMQLRTIKHQEHTLNITISVGVSCARDGYPATLKQLVKMADVVLYEAKASGRNRVMAWRVEERGDGSGVA